MREFCSVVQIRVACTLKERGHSEGETPEDQRLHSHTCTSRRPHSRFLSVSFFKFAAGVGVGPPSLQLMTSLDTTVNDQHPPLATTVPGSQDVTMSSRRESWSNVNLGAMDEGAGNVSTMHMDEDMAPRQALAVSHSPFSSPRILHDQGAQKAPLSSSRAATDIRSYLVLFAQPQIWCDIWGE